jgi:hypothetical protein
MKWERFAILSALVLVGLARSARADAPVASVRGHAISQRVKLTDHQPFLDSISTHAWVDVDGEVGGHIVWTSVYNGGGGDQGQGVSGWTWFIEVDTFLILSPNEVYVEGVIAKSNFPEDPFAGERAGVFIYDGGSESPDTFNGEPIVNGNFRVNLGG